MKGLIPWRWGQKNAAPARVNDWFDRGWERRPLDNPVSLLSSSFSNRLPTVDVSEDKKEVNVKAEIPGMTEKDISLTWHDGVLSIRGEKRDEKEEKKKDRYYRECRYGSFCRNINLGKHIDWTHAKALYKNGVLAVSLPKTQPAQKTVEIKVN